MHLGYANDIFIRGSNPYNLRNHNNLIFPPVLYQSTLFFNSIYYKGPSIWYNLNNQFKTISSIFTFKTKLLSHLLNIQNQGD